MTAVEWKRNRLQFHCLMTTTILADVFSEPDSNILGLYRDFSRILRDEVWSPEASSQSQLPDPKCATKMALWAGFEGMGGNYATSFGFGGPTRKPAALSPTSPTRTNRTLRLHNDKNNNDNKADIHNKGDNRNDSNDDNAYINNHNQRSSSNRRKIGLVAVGIRITVATYGIRMMKAKEPISPNWNPKPHTQNPKASANDTHKLYRPPIP